MEIAFFSMSHEKNPTKLADVGFFLYICSLIEKMPDDGSPERFRIRGLKGKAVQVSRCPAAVSLAFGKWC